MSVLYLACICSQYYWPRTMTGPGKTEIKDTLPAVQRLIVSGKQISKENLRMYFITWKDLPR